MGSCRTAGKTTDATDARLSASPVSSPSFTRRSTTRPEIAVSCRASLKASSAASRRTTTIPEDATSPSARSPATANTITGRATESSRLPIGANGTRHFGGWIPRRATHMLPVEVLDGGRSQSVSSELSIALTGRPCSG
jgi:hypothetical protein